MSENGRRLTERENRGQKKCEKNIPKCYQYVPDVRGIVGPKRILLQEPAPLGQPGRNGPCDIDPSRGWERTNRARAASLSS